MQHTLTPFLIRALSKTEGEKREREETETERRRESKGGRLRRREEYEGGKKESRVCCIDFLAVWHRP